MCYNVLNERGLTMSVVINNQNCAYYSYIVPYIRYCAENRYQSPWVMKQRIISDYEFIFITKGKGQFKIEGRIYNAKANDLLLIKPNVVNSGNSVILPFNFLCIHFDLFVSLTNNAVIDMTNNNLCESIPSEPIKYNSAILDFPEYTSVSDSGYVHQLLKRIIHESNVKIPGYNTIIKSLFIDMIFNLFRQQSGFRLINNFTSEINAIIDYIKDNYMNKIRLRDIADHIHLQPAYISSLFKKQTGYTLTEFIKRQRVISAKRLLLETDRKIQDIAYDTGFYDIHHFSRIFKQLKGLTPGQYRNIKGITQIKE